MIRSKKSAVPLGLVACLSLFLLSSACKKFTPPAASQTQPFKDRIQKETQEDITVSVAVPTKAETIELYGTDLYAQGMQPVWIRVENYSKDNLSLLTSSMDPEYYSPNEASYKTQGGYSGKGKWDREIFFQKMSLPLNIPPKSVGSGHVITHVDKGTKYINLDILTEHDFKRFSFLIDIPRLPGEYREVDFDKLYPPGEIREVSLEELKAELEKIPCCAPHEKGGIEGDPINLVVIAKEGEGLLALTRSGWREAEHEVDRTKQSRDPFLAKRPYKHKLRVPLWYLGRKQDVGFNKPRKDFEERNQFWLWLTPWRYQGKKVWVGTTTRDIGIRYKVESPYLIITHKIDSDVDETREYIFEDLLSIGAVEKVAWVKGVGAATPKKPQIRCLGRPLVYRWSSHGPFSYRSTDGC